MYIEDYFYPNKVLLKILQAHLEYHNFIAVYCFFIVNVIADGCRSYICWNIERGAGSRRVKST
jgi:hypothetical protein